jgi:hypothetical protein
MLCKRRAQQFQQQQLANPTPNFTCVQLWFNQTAAYDQFIGNSSSYADVINPAMYQNSTGATFAWHTLRSCSTTQPAICELPGTVYQCPPAPPPKPPPPLPDSPGLSSLCEHHQDRGVAHVTCVVLPVSTDKGCWLLGHALVGTLFLPSEASIAPIACAHPRLPACPPARLPACPPARLPACPPARLPACPPAHTLAHKSSRRWIPSKE